MTRKFKQKHKATEIVIVGRFRSEDEVIAFLEADASDFRIIDSESLDDFYEAVQSTLQGEIDHQPERTRALFARLQKLSAEVSRIKTIDTMVLTDREMEILRLLDEGQSNKQIAKAAPKDSSPARIVAAVISANFRALPAPAQSSGSQGLCHRPRHTLAFRVRCRHVVSITRDPIPRDLERPWNKCRKSQLMVHQ